MHTIILGNEKGGVGKTTLTINYAAYLASHGFKVLVVDTDVQGHAGISFNIPPGAGLYELLVRGAGWDTLAKSGLLANVPTEYWNAGYENAVPGSIRLLRSNDETGVIPNLIKSMDVLYDRLEELEGYVDVICIDTPPTASMLQVAIYYAGDSILVPTQVEDLSIHGLIATVGRISNEANRRKDTQRPFKFIGVQPTFMDWRRSLHKDTLRDLEDHFGEMCFPAISNRAAWANASKSKESIFKYASDVNEETARRAAEDAQHLFATISEKVLNHA